MSKEQKAAPTQARTADDWGPGVRVTLCSMGYVHGPLTDEAKAEIREFAKHLQDHRASVEGCRFCAVRAARKAERGNA